MAEPPEYVITKVETYDPNVLESIVKDTNYEAKYRVLLRNYKKGTKGTTPNSRKVFYQFSKSCQSLHLGRLYPVNIGLQGFPTEIRNALLGPYYWDVDIENCHYVIGSQYADKATLPTTAMKEYINNRDEALLAVSPIRDVAKTAFLKIFFGSVFDNKRNNYTLPDDTPLITRIKKEVATIEEHVWLRNPSLHQKARNTNKENPKGSLLSLILQDDERKCLMALDAYLTKVGRSMDVLIHDGGLLRKLDGETTCPTELLRGGEEAIRVATGYSIRLVNKPMKTTFPEQSNEIDKAYKIMKDKWETDHFHFEETNKVVRVEEKNNKFKLKYWALHDAKDVFNMWLYSSQNSSFIERWLGDPHRRMIRRFVMKQDDSDCAPDEFNAFRGFVFENENVLEDEVEDKKSVELFLNILGAVCNDKKHIVDFMIRIFAHNVQKPLEKTGVCPIFSNNGQGTGKDTICLIMRKMFGNHVAHYTDQKVLFDKHDVKRMGAIFVHLEEVGADMNHKNAEILKAMITTDTLDINDKGIRGFEVEDYCNYIMTTNSPTPVKIEETNRRYLIIIGSKRLMGNRTFWKSFYDYTKIGTTEPNMSFLAAVGNYLKSVDLTDFNPTDLPKDELSEEISMLAASPEKLFLEQWTGVDVCATDLYNDYMSYCRENHIQNRMAQGVKSFCQRLLHYTEYFTKRRSNGILYTKIVSSEG